jgi:Leucine-rich repeat (LRR) protein
VNRLPLDVINLILNYADRPDLLPLGVSEHAQKRLEKAVSRLEKVPQLKKIKRDNPAVAVQFYYLMQALHSEAERLEYGDPPCGSFIDRFWWNLKHYKGLIEDVYRQTLLVSARDHLYFQEQIEGYRLKEITVLSLGCLSFLSQEVTRMKNLKLLIFINARLTEFPIGVEKMKSMTQLVYTKCSAESILQQIPRFPNLVDLHLDECRITELPLEFSQLKHLKDLSLSKNLLSEFPPVLTALTSLEWVSLSDNQIRRLPDAITKLVNLKMLDIKNNPLERVRLYPKLIKLVINGPI